MKTLKTLALIGWKADYELLPVWPASKAEGALFLLRDSGV
jgi:hypothetical protein